MLPGGVLPASLAYEALSKELGAEVHAVAKELEVYRDEAPPADYTLDVEVAGILRCADESGFDRFHLVGYSGGGASSLAFAAAHPGRLRSLALLEPAWAGNDDLSPEEATQFGALAGALIGLGAGGEEGFVAGAELGAAALEDGHAISDAEERLWATLKRAR